MSAVYSPYVSHLSAVEWPYVSGMSAVCQPYICGMSAIPNLPICLNSINNVSEIKGAGGLKLVEHGNQSFGVF